MSPSRILIEAGAGCGKTTLLVKTYIQHLGIGEKISPAPSLRPSEILAVTFTEEAAREMQIRILEEIHKVNSPFLLKDFIENNRISTFHSLCYKTLHPYLSDLGYATKDLCPPSLSRSLRKKSILLSILKHPESKKFLSLMPLSHFVSLVNDLWFSPLNKENIQNILRNLKGEAEQFKNTLLSECVKLSPKNEGLFWVETLIQILENKENAPTIEELVFHKGKGVKEFNSKNAPLLDLAKAYKTFRQEHLENSLSDTFLNQETVLYDLICSFVNEARAATPKILDFSALEYELFHFIQSPLGQKNIPKARFIMVDEFQDTNETQFAIIQGLSGSETDWFFVGDPKQSIYRFRGADVSLFLKLRERLTRKDLDTNYRSERPILEFCNLIQKSLFSSKSLYDPSPQELKPAKPASTSDWQVKVVETDEEYDFEATLKDYNDLKQNHELQSHAFLFPDWNTLYRFSQHLHQNSIHHAISGSHNLSSHHLTALFSYFLKWWKFPDSPMEYYSVFHWSEINRSWPSSAEKLLELEKIDRAKIVSDTQSILEIFYRFVEWIRPERWFRGSLWIACMERFLGFYKNYEEKHPLSMDELAYYFEKEFFYEESFDPDTGTVSKEESESSVPQLLTIHGSKGLQFDAVYLPKLYSRSSRQMNDVDDSEEGSAIPFKIHVPEIGLDLPSLFSRYREIHKKAQIEAEQKRLFYVALTRAKKRLLIYGKSTKTTQESPKQQMFAKIFHIPSYERSPWMSHVFEALKVGTSQTLLQSLESSEIHRSPPQLEQQWLLPKNKENPLHFLPCSRMGVSEYLSQDSENRDPPRSGEHDRTSVSSKTKQDWGTAFHEILEYWNGDIEVLSYLLKKDLWMKPLLLELRELPELANYWNTLKAFPNEVVRETSIYSYYDDAKLSGKIDALVFSNNNVQLIDWKTTHSLASLRKLERIEKMRNQLRIYAHSLKESVKNIQMLVIGIELNPDAPFHSTPRTATIVDERY